MSKQNTAFQKGKKVEIAKPDFQPSMHAKKEDMRLGLTFEELTKAVLSDTEVKQVDKPNRDQ